MSEQNPYQAPDANLVEGRQGQNVELAVTGIKSLPAMAGWGWIKQAFELFKKSPWIWIVMVIIWFVLNIVGQIIPIIGPIAMSLLYAVFMAGFMYGCVALERGEALEIGHLFAGFKQNTGALIGLGGLYLLVMIVIGIVMVMLVFGGMGGTAIFTDPESLQGMDPENMFSAGTLIMMLVVLALIIPIVMAFWFAPVLVALGGVPVMSSLKMSFMGCLKNIPAFLIYSIAMIILAVVASIPLFLGWLVLLPVSIAVFYTAYREIYTS